jgi:hypothetical protein
MPDAVDHAIECRQDVVVPEPQNAITVPFDGHGARAVSLERMLFIMLSTIEFNDKPRVVTREVGNVARDGNLTPEVPAFRLQEAQLLPKHPLCRRCIAAKIAREPMGHHQSTMRISTPAPWA